MKPNCKRVYYELMSLPDEDVLLSENRGLARLPSMSPALRHLNVSFNKLATLDALPASLEVLDVSHNRLTSLDAVRRLGGLRILRAHANSLSGLEPVTSLGRLEELWLCRNAIEASSEILRLRGLPLEELRLRPNGACDFDKYRDVVLAMLPALRVLDDDVVQEPERVAARAFADTIDGDGVVHRLKAEGRHIDKFRRPAVKTTTTLKARRRPKRLARLLPEAPAPALRQPWPDAPTAAVMRNYADGSVAVCAPGDGSVVVRWPRGQIAVSADAGCLRAFHESGLLAVICDRAGNATVNSVRGRTLLSLRAQGGGFKTDHAGCIEQDWRDASNPPGTLELALSSNDDAPLGVSIDTELHFARVFLDLKGLLKCVVAQNGAVDVLPTDSDLFGHAQQPRPPSVVAVSSSRRHPPRDKRGGPAPRGAAQSHAELIERIRQATAMLP